MFRVLGEVVFFFFAVAPPGLFRPDVVPQTFFCYSLKRPGGAAAKKKHHPGLAEIAPAHRE